jgi:hypothetical protein
MTSTEDEILTEPDGFAHDRYKFVLWAFLCCGLSRRAKKDRSLATRRP